MAFMKYANAVVSEASIRGEDWAAVKQSSSSMVFNTKTASSIINEYPPSEYLLTHSTIIASVDVEDAPNAKTGEIKEAGRTINRKWSDFYITSDTSKYVNGNADSWDRQTLLNTYKTFVGAENYVEHIQVPDLSKGKVIDAAARDLGDTVYIDILVATSRKHEELINDIQSGKINTLSMGCSIDYSRCSKCGNVAADETELCEHIKYSKGNFFHDKKGNKRIIAEICFPGDTRVVVEDGTRVPLSEIHEGQKVLTHKGVSMPVNETMERDYKGDLIQLDVLGQPEPFKSTPNHPYLVLQTDNKCSCGCGSELSKIKTGAKHEYTQKYLPGHNPNQKGFEMDRELEFAFERAENIDAGDILALPIPQRTVEPEGLNLNRAEILGWFLAEGSYLKDNQGNHIGIEFTLNAADEVGIAEKLSDLLEQEFKPEIAGNKETQARTIEALEKGKQCPPRIHKYDRTTEDGQKLVVCYTNRRAAEFMLKHAGEYSNHKCLSSDAIYWPEEIQEQLLKSYVKGDGCVDKQRRHHVTSTSVDLIDQMQLIAARCGIWTRRQVIWNGKSCYSHVGREGQRGDDNFLPSHKLYFQRSDNTDQFFEMVSDQDSLVSSPAWRQEGDYFLYKVKSTSRIPYDGKVYNLSVANINSYLVEGLAVHNCGHSSDPDSVTFIEASWVANPAFKGAVLREVLNGDDDLTKEERKAEIDRQKQLMDASPMLREFMENQNIDKFIRKANDLTEGIETIKSMRQDLQSVLASVQAPQNQKQSPAPIDFEAEQVKESFGPGPDEDEDEDDDTPPLEDVKEDLKDKLRDDVTKDLLQELQEDMDLALTEPMFEGPADAPQLNENIIKAYQTFAGRYASELKTSEKLRKVFSVVYAAKVNGWKTIANMDGVSNKEIVTAMYLQDRDDPKSQCLPQSLYTCLLKIGSKDDYRTLRGFLNACELAMGRQPTTQEARILIERSSFLQ